ncbi:unnamed protein product [Porites evermanni]|uniref:Uncharacterized protein n=1 Tax=Porites evermanni TaxID=104178 RepID=A0ABN8SZF5_9CNID|nr:unnamed protein product [Porites evermanni]
MEIPNYDSGDNPDKKYKQLFPYMPSNTFRMLICGNSGSGKTNLLYHMLIKPLLYYDEIYLYARNLEQDKYQKLIQKMREMSSKLGYEILHVSNDEITPVSEMDYEDNKKLVIFDDYVYDNSSGSPSTSRLTVDSNIDMKDTYRIQNLITPQDSKDPATKCYVDNTFLNRDGSYPMKGNLNMDNNRILNLPAPNGVNQPTPLAFTDLKYLHVAGTNNMTNNLNMDNKKIINLRPPTDSTDGATKKYVDDSIPDTSSFIKKDGSVAMTGNLNVGNKKIVGLVTPTSNTDAATKKYVDDNAGSPDLSNYFKKDGTVTMTGNLNLGNNKIVGLATPVSNTDAATKKYVDDNVGSPDLSDYLEKDGTVAMTGNLDLADVNLGGNNINNLGVPTQDNEAVTKGYVDNLVHSTAVQPSHYKDEFSYLMSSGAQWTDETDGGNIDPDKVYDYHTAFDIKPKEVVYNVDINANQKEIKNIKLDRQNDNKSDVTTLKDFYSHYHKKYWCYKRCYKSYKFLDDVFSISGICLVAIGTITGGITLNPIVLGVVNGAGVVVAGIGKKKNYKRKIEMSRIAFTTYEKVLVELRSALRGDEWSKQDFVDRMKLIDEMIIDQSPIADRFASRYNEKFNIK